MLKKGFRLTKKEDFDRVFRSGKPLFFEEIACRYAPNNLSYLRLGFSISKKHFPLAVERNRLRRLITAAIEAENFLPSGVDIVFFSIKKQKSANYRQFQGLIEKAFKCINKQR